MARGWFDAWREEGGPALHPDPNRTHVVVDPTELLIIIAFSSLLIAFWLIVPGIRKERFTTCVYVTVNLVVGASILIGIHARSWHVAQENTHAYYKAYSEDHIPAVLGVNIGLKTVNVTYAVQPDANVSLDIDYNEEFHFTTPTTIKDEFHASLVKGLPYPILTVLDYLRQDSGGFKWGPCYRKAGAWTYFFLWASFAMWLLYNILLCAVPRYGAYTLQLTGFCMLISVFLYHAMLPKIPLAIPLENGLFLRFQLGWCFWLVFVSGCLAIGFGAIMAIVDTLFPSKFSTILEVDYDTPYRYFVGQGASNSRNPSVANTPHSTMRFRASNVSVASVSGLFGEEDDETRSTSIVTKDGGQDNDGFEMHEPATDEEEDGMVSMVDGKRAVTLQDFGKFAVRHHRPDRRRSYGGATTPDADHPFHSGVLQRRGTDATFTTTIQIHDQTTPTSSNVPPQVEITQW